MNEEKFTGKADIYAKFRPTYPEEFIDYLYSEIGVSAESKIADIGAGTGILSKLLLLRDSSVICIKPNADMLNIAKQELITFAKCSFVETSAENTNLEENSIDFITVAQAFHWFERERFKIECKRILRNNGKVILVWNSKDKSQELVIANEKINKKFCPNFRGFAGGTEEKAEGYSDFFKNGICDIKEYKNNSVVDEEGFIGGNLSASYAPNKDFENYNEYINELKKVFVKYSKDGKFVIPYITRCYIGEV